MLFFSQQVASCSLWLHGLQHTRLSCPSLSPVVYSDSCPLSQWRHPNSSFSATLCLFPSIFPSIRVFPKDLTLHTRWPKYWSISIRSSNEYSGMISFRIDWFDLHIVQETWVFSSTTIWKHQPILTCIPDYWKNHSFDYRNLCQPSDVCAF